MTRSIFDPGGGETEHSGSTFLGAEAANDWQVPLDVPEADAGDAGAEAGSGGAAAEADAPAPVASDSRDAARRLNEMTGDPTTP